MMSKCELCGEDFNKIKRRYCNKCCKSVIKKLRKSDFLPVVKKMYINEFADRKTISTMVLSHNPIKDDYSEDSFS